MNALRKWTFVAVVTGATAVGGISGAGLTARGQAAPDAAAPGRPPVELTPQQANTVGDLAKVFREVGRVTEPSVVSIQVTKQVAVPRMPRPFADPNLRRFFRDFGGPGGPDLPPDLFDDQGSDDQGQRKMRQIGTGSGVIMEVDGGTGYVLTNNHVAGGASELEITLSDGRVIKNAKVVGTDPKTDLAVVRIEADRLTAAKWGDSGQLQPGDWVMAFGSPFGYVGSMTHGIVSALHRKPNILGPAGYESFIQVDAPINPGNSGGPLVNLRGEVVGINTAIATQNGGFQGIGFAVPSELAKPVYAALKQNGTIVRGWLGAQIADVSKLKDEAKAAGYSGDSGVLIKGVLNDAPAAGKLQPGDVVTALDGKNVPDAEKLRNQIALLAPGTEAKFDVVREGKPQQVTVKLGEQPESTGVAGADRNGSRRGGSPQQESAMASLGLRLADLNDQLAQRFDLSTNQQGALVVQVRPGSIAAQAGIQPGDLITRVGQQSVTNAEEASAALRGADLNKGVRLYVTNREGSQFYFLQSEGEQ